MTGEGGSVSMWEPASSSPFSVCSSYRVRSTFVKAHSSSSPGLSHCCIVFLLCFILPYVLEPFFRSSTSPKNAPCGPPVAISGHNLQQCTDFPVCSRTEGTTSTACWLISGNVMFCVRGPHGSPHVFPMLIRITPLCSWL